MRHWSLFSTLLLVVASAGYGLAHGAMRSPLLRTIAMGDRVGPHTFDADYGRLYIGAKTNGIQMLDTRTGALL